MKDIDFSKPLSDEDRSYLLERMPEGRVDYLVRVAQGPESKQFDPSDESVESVVAYLLEADEDEKLRVLELEADGKKRKGILGG